MRGLAPFGLLLLAWSLAPSAGVAAAPAPDPESAHLGAGSCSASVCHGGGDPKRNEFTIVKQKDRHARAWESLRSDRGMAIARRYGVGDATKAPACLACHSTDPERFAAEKTLDPRDGVSCELCHGGAKRWLGPHAAKDWGAEKRASFGMADLSTPAARVKACMECHVGAPGRQVDHRMYASGHPPLRFEAAEYVARMPPHWVDEGDPGPATLLEGLRAAAALELARAESGSTDFAQFDCDSCHHPVGVESNFSRNDPPGTPGEPARDFASAMTLAALLGADPSPTPAAARAAIAAPGEPSLENLVRYLGRVEAESPRVPPNAMRQMGFAARTLAGVAAREVLPAAWQEAERAIERVPYDAAECARRLRAAIGAGR